jgi:hypothetical protein
MGKGRNISNNLTMLGVKIQKHRERRDGEGIYLCSFIGNDRGLILCHLNAQGEIVDSKYFDCCGTVAKVVKAQALKEYNLWKQILMLRIDDYTIGPAVLLGKLPGYQLS